MRKVKIKEKNIVCKKRYQSKNMGLQLTDSFSMHPVFVLQKFDFVQENFVAKVARVRGSLLKFDFKKSYLNNNIKRVI